MIVNNTHPLRGQPEEPSRRRVGDLHSYFVKMARKLGVSTPARSLTNGEIEIVGESALGVAEAVADVVAAARAVERAVPTGVPRAVNESARALGQALDQLDALTARSGVES